MYPQGARQHLIHPGVSFSADRTVSMERPSGFRCAGNRTESLRITADCFAVFPPPSASPQWRWQARQVHPDLPEVRRFRPVPQRPATVWPQCRNGGSAESSSESLLQSRKSSRSVCWSFSIRSEPTSVCSGVPCSVSSAMRAARGVSGDGRSGRWSPGADKARFRPRRFCRSDGLNPGNGPRYCRTTVTPRSAEASRTAGKCAV